jgi:hypothetical protein
MISANPTLDLLLQDKSNECKNRNSASSHRISAFGFPTFLAVHIAIMVLIHSNVLKTRRNEKLRDRKEQRRQPLQGSYVNESVS